MKMVIDVPEGLTVYNVCKNCTHNADTTESALLEHIHMLNSEIMMLRDIIAHGTPIENGKGG